MLGPLVSSQGPGAAAWLRHCLEDSAQEPMAAPETAAIDQALLEVPDSPGLDSPGIAVPVTQSPGADSPAPAPASLEALRAWLPDRSDDLPLAG